MTFWPPPKEFTDFVESNFCKVNFDPKALDENEENSVKTRFAGHCLIWCKTLLSTSELSDEPIHFKALLNMHLRFDGKLGYPGGIIDPGETIIEGVQREILEETNLKMKLTPDDFVASMEEEYKAIRHGKEYEKIKLYFFSKEIDEETFLKFEDESRQAKHFGIEILGHIRAPLYRFRQTEGLPRFLTNSFAGTAKVQLLLAICKNNLLAIDEIISAYKVHHH